LKSHASVAQAFGPAVRFSLNHKRFRRLACSSLIAGAAAITLATSPAHSYTLLDNYYGGTNTYNNPGDVIGDSTFYITSAVVTRSGPNNDTLNIIINTNFAGAPGTSPADGTGYGALFLSTGTWSPTGTGPNYPTDTYKPNEWQYAVTTPQNPGSGSIGTTTSGLYAIGGNATAVPYGPNPLVAQSYTTDNGTVVMSNVSGDPVTYPDTGHTTNPAYYFREGQAVQYTPNDPTATVAAATWSVDALAHTITYTIVDNGLFGTSFALAWAMTCANDVIQGQVMDLPPGGPGPNPTPLPATLPLFASGLGALGLLSWRRKRKNAALAA
jgi:hypothetical protein